MPRFRLAGIPGAIREYMCNTRQSAFSGLHRKTREFEANVGRLVAALARRARSRLWRYGSWRNPSDSRAAYFASGMAPRIRMYPTVPVIVASGTIQADMESGGPGSTGRSRTYRRTSPPPPPDKNSNPVMRTENMTSSNGQRLCAVGSRFHTIVVRPHSAPAHYGEEANGCEAQRHQGRASTPEAPSYE